MAATRPAALIDRLGFQDLPEALHLRDRAIDRAHPYAAELSRLLEAEPSVLGVYDVDGVPAVCLVAGDPAQGDSAYDALRAQLWNQGLVSLLLVVGRDAVQAWPIPPKLMPGPVVDADQLDRSHAYSAYGVRSDALRSLHPDWFNPRARVDKVLLRNLTVAIDKLVAGRSPSALIDAQHLMAQVLFVSYLEHRGLITASFRKEKGLRPFDVLLAERDQAGLERLFAELKTRFNGDFLAPTNNQLSWSRLSEAQFAVLDRFLKQDDLAGGQQSLWPYDFRYIPIELLSGLYETFLAERKKNDAAYYTPRHLAQLAVDEAFRGRTRPEDEVVWDGACGSGILLTAAFRRMLGSAEARAGKRLGLAERSRLLTSHIFGGDINAAACKVTAFSLYLCLLEDLPEPPRTKLPELLGSNIFDQSHHGDFFSAKHPIVSGKAPRPTIAISNPPWREPAGSQGKQAYETWSKARKLKIPLRQIATAFAFRVAELVEPGGRLCLIMPAGAFARPQHRKFLERWLEEVRLTRLINFSDLRLLLFPGAKHPCMVVVAEPATADDASLTRVPPSFEYVTPKADLGLLYNRLVIHASDRRTLLQSQLSLNPRLVQGLYWGSERELAEVERLRLQGTIGSVIARHEGASGGGFHMTDGTKAISPGFLRQWAHIDANSLPGTGPALPKHCLQPWPRELSQIASRGDRALYEGARVIVPNGMTSHHRIRAFAVTEPASITNSCSALRLGVGGDALARFAAAYLCSRFGAYLALLLAPSAVMERTQIKHGELLELPFRLPSQHSDPERAQAIVKEVARWVAKAEKATVTAPSEDLPQEIEEQIQEYFEISPTLSVIVSEVAQLVLPNLQPTTIESVSSPLSRAPTLVELRRYAATLVAELERSRRQLDGMGGFEAQVDVWNPGQMEGLGRVSITVSPQGRTSKSAVSTAAVDALLSDLRQHGLLAGVLDGGLALRGDVLVQEGATIHFAKPLVRRLWLTSAALDDALKIVRHVHQSAQIA
ncbi:MAG: hypothetical protein CL625_03500 [Arenimonas sp.]|nr:hypothetical protein [Arenimonas sp.]